MSSLSKKCVLVSSSDSEQETQIIAKKKLKSCNDIARKIKLKKSSTAIINSQFKRKFVFEKDNQKASHSMNVLENDIENPCIEKTANFYHILDSQSSKFDSKNKTNSNGLWMHDFSPNCTENLAITKSKVKQTKDWLVKATSSCKPMILLLNGPTGSGKTTLVKTLCKGLNIKIKEYETLQQKPVAFGSNNYENVISECDRFRNFLIKATRYANVDSCENKKEILLIDQLIIAEYSYGNGNVQSSEKFIQVFMEYMSLLKAIPVVLITSSENKNSLDEHNTEVNRVISFINYNHSFEKINICKVTDRNMCKHMKDILKKLKLSCKKSHELPEEIKSFNGNMGKMINYYQFKYTLYKEHTPTHKNTDLSDYELELFHLIGKIIYCKWEETNHTKNTIVKDSRYTTKEDMQKLCDLVSVKKNMFTNLIYKYSINHLHDIENYMNFVNTMCVSDCISTIGFMIEDTINQQSSLLLAVKGYVVEKHKGYITRIEEGKESISNSQLSSQREMSKDFDMPTDNRSNINENRRFVENFQETMKQIDSGLSHISRNDICSYVLPYISIIKNTPYKRNYQSTFQRLEFKTLVEHDYESEIMETIDDIVE